MIENCYLIAKRQLAIRGARCAMGPSVTSYASIQITGDRISRIINPHPASPDTAPGPADIDLSGFLILPGFVNAHDHLQFALFPRLGNPPYSNYIDWGEDIHAEFADLIAIHRTVPKEIRLWWGGIRNLLCGVTTVCHHDPLWSELRRKDFPVRVVGGYGWGHSLALGGDLRQAHADTPAGQPFLVHACEGVDETAREELWELDRLGVLDSRSVLVHGLALDDSGVSLMRERRASLIICPSSNKFLFQRLPDISLLSRIENVALGSDSPLTAEGDLLDEVRFAMSCSGISSTSAYRMVTTTPAAILCLGDAQGTIKESGLGDLIAIRDTGQDPADRLQTLSMNDIEFVMIGGRVQLATESILERLPFAAKQDLEPISIDGFTRWLRVPVQTLLHGAEEVLGKGELRLGSRKICIPSALETVHAH
jgi:cytosine/adenosine deaminase-related metal-dependent hydrolase